MREAPFLLSGLLCLVTFVAGVFCILYTSTLYGILMIFFSFLFLFLVGISVDLDNYGYKLDDLITRSMGAPAPSSSKQMTAMYPLILVPFLIGFFVFLYGPKYSGEIGILIMLIAFIFFCFGGISAKIDLHNNKLNHLALHIAPPPPPEARLPYKRQQDPEAKVKGEKLPVYWSEAASSHRYAPGSNLDDMF